MSRYVVTGTDTGVGKTLVSAALAGHLGAHYWKPVQAGLDETTDRDMVAQLSGLPASHILPEAYRLTTPCSPHEAARIDGVEIDPARLTPPTVSGSLVPDSLVPGSLVVEGAGGVLVPLSMDTVYADLFAQWQLPVILVARTALGTINHSLLSLEALRSRAVPVHGVIFSGEENAASEQAICHIGQVRHLGRLPQMAVIDAQSLRAAFAANVRTELL